MTVQDFVYRIKYKSAECPEHVNQMRWQGMLVWWSHNWERFL
jgi:hypothetical protein